MITSEILKEKTRVQTMLSANCSSVHEYLLRSHQAARDAAAAYGVSLRYTQTDGNPNVDCFRPQYEVRLDNPSR